MEITSYRNKFRPCFFLFSIKPNEKRFTVGRNNEKKNLSHDTAQNALRKLSRRKQIDRFSIHVFYGIPFILNDGEKSNAKNIYEIIYFNNDRWNLQFTIAFGNIVSVTIVKTRLYSRQIYFCYEDKFFIAF